MHTQSLCTHLLLNRLFIACVCPEFTCTGTLELEWALLRNRKHDQYSTPGAEAADARALAQGYCQHVCTGANILPCRDILKAPDHRLGVIADEVSK